jgi:DNA replication protein DnaC
MFVLPKKLEIVKQDIVAKCGCNVGCPKCSKQMSFVEKIAEAGIPVAYWFLKMSDFNGADNIKKATDSYITSIKENYQNGESICFAGTLGTGKTYSLANILKAALAKNYSAYYTSLSEMVNNLTSYETKVKCNALVTQSDFLAIDEVDSRHIAASDAAQEFFGASFERIIRFRIQNKLPTLMATNNAGLEEAFSGQFKDYRLTGLRAV